MKARYKNSPFVDTACFETVFWNGKHPVEQWAAPWVMSRRHSALKIKKGKHVIYPFLLIWYDIFFSGNSFILGDIINPSQVLILLLNPKLYTCSIYLKQQLKIWVNHPIPESEGMPNMCLSNEISTGQWCVCHPLKCSFSDNHLSSTNIGPVITPKLSEHRLVFEVLKYPLLHLPISSNEIWG